ncbi:MAG: hypothetical protein CM15mP87_03400 [Candidatus Neomarinimicrobiota bacterium]|nr:MAG: hypothetical protein CM15mP87_03400 [Candidatus Neomarinimicrobiota bacterium]
MQEELSMRISMLKECFNRIWEHDFEVFLSSRENVELNIPYEFKIESKSMVPPRMIIADFAISNDFGTIYSKDEIVKTYCSYPKRWRR